MTFASMEGQFAKANCKLVGLSVDGLYSHIAWLRTIKEKIEYRGMKNVEVKFPLIEDITMEVAKKYGMIQPGESSTKAVRAVFFIDPKGIIRAIIYYPLSLGSNFDEMYRMLVAPDGRRIFRRYPGGLAARRRCNRASGRFLRGRQGPHGGKEEMKCYDWFFCTKPISKEKVFKTVLNSRILPG